MIVYNYDRITKEYLGSERAFLDKVASFREGKEIYLMPAYSTTVEPPKKVKDNEVLIWTGRKWETKPDFRGQVIYNMETREARICEEIGALPSGYVTELKPSLNETKARYLSILKANFNQYLKETKIEIPGLGLAFSYNSIDNIKAEKDLGLTVSRDDNNNIYSNLTSEQYDDIINYLTIFGQVLYLNKWEAENSIKKCKNIELLENIKDKLNVKVDMSHLKNLMKMPEEKRKDYFIRTANNIK